MFQYVERFKVSCLVIVSLLFASSIVFSACDAEGTLGGSSHTPESSVTATARGSEGGASEGGVSEDLTSEGGATEQKSTSTPTVEAHPVVEIPATVTTPPSSATMPTLTATVSPATLIPGMIGPDVYASDINPLTGLIAEDPETLARRPIAIKISNNARVRPQAGLNSADLVFEHLTEGGITRFTAIYYSRDSGKVGSIRSGRLIDLEIPIMYDAAFGYSGSSTQLRLMFLNSLFFDRIISPDFAHGGFERISNPTKAEERVEDTLYTDTIVLRWILDQRGQNISPEFRNGMAFHPEPPEGGAGVTGVEIIYPATGAYWYYSPGLGGYLRWSDGIPHLDSNTGQQFVFNNIVVIEATHLASEIIEDSGGSPSLQIQLWGEGPVSIYRNSQRFDGIWRRLDSRDMLTFFTTEGDILPLSPGKTFFQIVPNDFAEVYDTP